VEVSLSRSRSPAANDVRVLFSCDIAIRSIGEKATVTSISFSTRPLKALFVVRAIDDVTILSNTEDATVVRSVGKAFLNGVLDGVVSTLYNIFTSFRESRFVFPVEARRKGMVGDLTRRSVVHKTSVHLSPLVLNRVLVVRIQSVEDDTTTLKDTS
jgi:hypothetical protein